MMMVVVVVVFVVVVVVMLSVLQVQASPSGPFFSLKMRPQSV